MEVDVKESAIRAQSVSPFGGGRGRKIDVIGKNLMPIVVIHF
ncbi:hypothetical protein [uncultured Acetobacteroides sp.]|nr:hypothetical protein [uncultured Acetobacteroides sp.]